MTPLQVAIQDNPPIMFSSLDQLLAASTVQCSDIALLNALRMVVSLRDSVLEFNPRLAGLTPSRLCGVLLLYNSSLSRLCLALQCPEMLQLAVQLLPGACPQLRYGPHALSVLHRYMQCISTALLVMVTLSVFSSIACQYWIHQVCLCKGHVYAEQLPLLCKPGWSHACRSTVCIQYHWTQ